MGLYDQFIIPSSGQHISTYAGAPIEEMAALGQALDEKYMQGMQGVSAFNVMRDNYKTLEADKEMRDAAFNRAGNLLKEYAEAGDYENALPAIMRASSEISSNEDLRKAKSNYESTQKFMQEIDKLAMKGDIPSWKRDLVQKRIGQYKGVSEGDNISNYLTPPSKTVDVQKLMQDAASKVRKTKRLGAPTRRDDLGKYIIPVEEVYDQNELQQQMTSALSSPEAIAHLNDMREYYGEDSTFVDDYLNQLSGSVTGALDSGIVDYKMVDIPKGVGSGYTGGPGGNVNYEFIPLSSDEKGLIENPVSFNDESPASNSLKSMGESLKNSGAATMATNPVSGITLRGLGGLMEKLGSVLKPKSLEERTDREKKRQAETKLALTGTPGTGGLTKVLWNGAKAILHNDPSKDEIKDYNALAEGFRNSYDVSEEEWDSMTPEGRNAAVAQFSDEIATDIATPKYTTTLNTQEAVDLGYLKNANVDYKEARNAIADYVKANAGSQAFYSFKDKEAVNPQDDKFLKEAMANNRFEIIGEVDPKNPMFSENPEFASGYLAKASDKKGNTQTFVVSKGAGAQNRSAQGLANAVNVASNIDPVLGTELAKIGTGEYNNAVMRLHNEAGIPGKFVDFKVPGTNINMDVSRDPKDRSRLRLKSAVINNSEVPINQLLRTLGRQARYDENRKEIYNLTEEDLLNAMYILELTQNMYENG